MGATWLCTLDLLDLMVLIIFVFDKAYKLSGSSLCSILHPHIISFLFGPNILLGALFLDILSLCQSSSLIAIKTTKIIVFYILVFTLLDSRREDKTF
jgi:hypothetical protein